MTNDPRSTYLDVGLSTAPPERLLLLLWDRLLVDLDVADDALHQGDLHAASERLIHAQDIVFELRSTLRIDLWDGATALAQGGKAHRKNPKFSCAAWARGLLQRVRCRVSGVGVDR